jgi:hypothetical protein
VLVVVSLNYQSVGLYLVRWEEGVEILCMCGNMGVVETYPPIPIVNARSSQSLPSINGISRPR